MSGFQHQTKSGQTKPSVEPAPEARGAAAKTLGAMGFQAGAEAVKPKAAAPASDHTGDPVQDVTPKKVEEAPVLVEDPALREKHRDGSMEYKRYEGDLFVNGVSAEDVEQGSIADCYLVAALSATAKAHPDLITNGVKPAGKGAFEVRFFERDYSGKYKEVWIKVDADLATAKGGSRPAYARSTEKNERGMELWPAIYEKAYAVWKKGYDKMGEGGSSQAALEALVGNRVQATTLSYTPEDQIWKKLQAATKDGKMVKAGSAGTHGKDQEEIYKDTNLYAWHAYTIMGIEEKDGARFVILRNPWGRTEPGSDGKDDGIFKLTIADFVKYYSNMNLEL